MARWFNFPSELEFKTRSRMFTLYAYFSVFNNSFSFCKRFKKLSNWKSYVWKIHIYFWKKISIAKWLCLKKTQKKSDSWILRIFCISQEVMFFMVNIWRVRRNLQSLQLFVWIIALTFWDLNYRRVENEKKKKRKRLKSEVLRLVLQPLSRALSVACVRSIIQFRLTSCSRPAIYSLYN